MNRWFWMVLLSMSASLAAAEGLYIQQEPHDENLCYISNAQGKRLFEGQYQNDCFAILPNQGLSADSIKPPYAVLNLLRYQNQDKVVINAQGQIVYYPYWYDNGPDYVEEGLVRIRNQQGLIGYAHAQSGKIVIAPQYFCASPFEKGRANVALKGKIVADENDHEMCVGEPEWVINQNGKRIG